jgi:hypothetical protein
LYELKGKIKTEGGIHFGDVAISKNPAACFQARGFYSGDVLLSHGLSPYYHRSCSVSLPCSEWERVVPLRYCHQSPMPDWRYGCFAAARTDTVALVTVSDTDTLQFHFRKNMIFNPQSQIENPQSLLVL